jgi:SAM-dependent methyltransferase
MINCPSCNNDKSELIYEIEKTSLSNMGLKSNLEDAVNSQFTNISLSKCYKCNLLFNSSFDESKVNYENKDTVTYFMNKPWLEYTIKSANFFSQLYINENHKNILEIGCGNGEFLSEINFNKNYNCFGYDPSLDTKFTSDSFHVVRDYFLPNKNNKLFDVIIIRHVLEHLISPFDFLYSIIKNQVENDNEEILFFLEVPNVKNTLVQSRFNDLVYEHVSYFSIETLSFLMKSLNIKILQITEVFDEENIQLIGKFSTKNEKSYEVNIDLFKNNVIKTENNIRHFFSSLINESICFWGAGGRGVTFINLISDLLDNENISVVDSDNRKHGMYVPISGYKIKSPLSFYNHKFDKIIITTALGEKGILDEIKKLNINALEGIYHLSNGTIKKIKNF